MMNDNQLDTVIILSKLLQKALVFNGPFNTSTLAVPITEISKMLEQFVTEQAIPNRQITEEE
jgi:hypothetical protein